MGDRMDHRRVDPELQRPARAHLVTLRRLVHLWHLRHFLAISELGRLYEELAEDESYGGECAVDDDGSRDMWLWAVCVGLCDSQ